MKIAISATGASLDAEVDPRFGRCQYFIIIDPDTMQFESVQNPNIMAAGGAGISTAQMIANSGVQVVLTGNCGPNAYEVLAASGIQVLTGISGKIRDAVQGYKSGQFQAILQPSVDAHFGMGSGMGMGHGMGVGMGMGRGMGRGMMGCGRGMGRGMGARMMPMARPATQPVNPEQEIETLKAQSQMLVQQLADIQRRIEDLQGKEK